MKKKHAEEKTSHLIEFTSFRHELCAYFKGINTNGFRKAFNCSHPIKTKWVSIGIR